ncbi:Cyclin L [Phaffia rhodozyma]|uniref:Cyclin L n=1 Tax=Phaffia rhodozyma TaxID=264483 RepID=A0A0F7SG78_PHARH|nr:Cyclin L [Phaffia rhodozyma]
MSIIFSPLASLRQIRLTPSREDGIPQDLEDDLRTYGAQLIQEAGRLAKLPQVAMATAQILFQRFWYVSSMKQFGIRDIGMGALYLATKLEECPMRLRDLVNVYDLLHQRSNYLLEHSSSSSSTTFPKFTYLPMAYSSSRFYDLKNAMVISEMQVLKRLGFNVQVQLPYGTLVSYCQMLGLVGNQEKGIVENAWGLLNDSLQTSLPALFSPSTLAASTIFLSVHQIGHPLPDRWWELFDVDQKDMVVVCGTILKLYERLDERTGARAWRMSEKTEQSLGVARINLSLSSKDIRATGKPSSPEPLNFYVHAYAYT